MAADQGTSTRLSVDRPGEGERPAVREQVVVEGWAWSPDGAPEVAVRIGDRPAQVRPGGWRPDVSAALGIGQLRGYVALAATTGMAQGPADVRVSATGADGITVEVSRTVEIAYDGARVRRRPRPWAGFPERLDPRAGAGGTTHVEHIARYRWAAQLARDRDVLDAACGVGYGAQILLEEGPAAGVTGVDAFAGAIIEAREQSRGDIEFTVGDLRELPFSAGSFDLVVCFEAIEHVTDPGHVLDELRRVLRPDGVLAISTPIPGAAALHNPHHVGELEPDALHRLLHDRFRHVGLRWQHTALASLVDLGPTAGRPAAATPPLRWTTGPIEPLYALALASDAELPRPEPAGALAAGYDIGALITQAVQLQDDVAEARAMLAAQRARAERAERAYTELERRYGDARRAHEQVAASEHTMRSSRSWELTAPLRAGADAWRRAARRWRA